MISKLRDIISEIAEVNKIKIEKWNMEKIRRIETNLNADGDIETAMVELDKVLGFKWDKFYKKIESNLESNKK